MIASLPMYLRAENAGAHDRFWTLICGELADPSLPDRLGGAPDPWDDWTNPALVLSQTCGLPYRTVLHDRVTLIGTPDYGLPGTPPGHYYSVLVVRRDDPRGDRLAEFEGTRLAVNDPKSQSGRAAPQAHMAATGLAGFSDCALTGSHRRSARTVLDGGADIAAIDAVTWRLIETWDSWSRGLRVICRTDPAPGLPLVTARPDLADRLAQAVATAIGRLPAADRAALGGLRGLACLSPGQYLSMPPPPVAFGS